MAVPGASQQEIIIQVGADIAEARRKLDILKTDIRQKMVNVRQSIMNAQEAPKGTLFSKDGELMGSKDYIASLRKELGELNLSYQQTGIDAQKKIEPLNKKLAKNKEELQRIQLEAKNARREFQGWALSIMFFGMAMKRTFDQIWKASTKTFQDVMHSVEGSVTKFDILEGSLSHLKFTAGEALEPLSVTMTKVVDWAQRLIEKHPPLFRSITAIFGVGGVLLTGLGMAVLSFNGLVEGISKAIANLKKFRAWARKLDASTFKNVGDKVKDLGKLISTKLIDSLKWIRNNPIKSIGAAGVVTGIILAVLWLKRMSDELGGVKQLGWAASEGLMKALAFPIAVVQALINKIQLLWYNIKNPGARAGASFRTLFNENLTRNLEMLMSDSRLEKGYIKEPRTLKQIWQADFYPEQQEIEETLGINQNPSLVINVQGNMTSEAAEVTMSEYERFASTQQLYTPVGGN